MPNRVGRSLVRGSARGVVWGFLGCFCAWIAVACSAARPSKQRPSLLDGLTTAPSYESPARFRYHPRELGDAHYARTLDDGAELLLGERGERWLVRATGRAEVASSFAPERLVDSVSFDDGEWLFVGESGAIFEADGVLGPFQRVGVPPEPLARVAVTSQAMLGVTFDGRLLRSLDVGTTWRPLDVEGRAVDVELIASGHGLVLTIPERLFATFDHGASWERVNQEPFGATALHARNDDIHIEAALAAVRYDPAAEESRRFSSAQSPLLAKHFEPQLPLGPSTMALKAGRADVSGERYFELAAGEQSWELRHGDVFEPLLTKGAREFDECQDTRLAASGSKLVVLCARSEGNEAELLLYRSDDVGKSWRRLPFELLGAIDQAWLELSPNGRFLLSGVCPLERSGAGCTKQGIHYFEPGSDKERPKLTEARAPSLSGLPLALSASNDGRRVYALARRTKGTALGVFVSLDGGETFSVQELSALEASSAQSASLIRVFSMVVDSDGYVSAVIYEPVSRQQLLLILDEQGRFISLSPAPVADASLGAVGLRSVAAQKKTGEVFESLDGGGRWRLLGAVPTAGCGQRHCDVQCFASGCTIGEAVTRVGWEGQKERPLHGIGLQANETRGRVRLVQSTAVCRFNDNSEWRPLRSELIPDAHSAALADTAWFAFDADFRDVRVDFHEMPLISNPTLVSQPLLAPSAVPQGTAMYFTHQIEGAAALRQTDGRGIEVAWRNLFEGNNVRRVKLPADIVVGTRVTRFQSRLATPAGLTIARGGIFAVPTENQAVFFDGSRLERLSVAGWPSSIQPGRDELLRVGARRLKVRFFASAATLAWTPVSSASGASAMTVGLPFAADFDAEQGMTIAYLRDRPGLYVSRQRGSSSESHFFPFTDEQRLLGAPVPVPDQSALSSVPARCSEQQRNTTPRLVAAYEAGTRHAVVVSDPSEPLPTLVTGSAILHGKPDDACAVVFDAAAVGGSSERVHALVFTDPLLPSWVFRKPPEGGEDDELEFRAMTCTFDPSAEVPEEVFDAPGTER